MALKSLRVASRVTALAVALAGVSGAVARADTSVDNPLYQAWAKFGVGTSTTSDTVIHLPMGDRHLAQTTTLKSVAPDKLTVETVLDGNGGHRNERDVNAKINAKIPDPTGEEDVTVAGKTYHCKVYTLDRDQLKSIGAGSATLGPGDNAAARVPITVKLWISSDVPGGVAKMHMEITMQMVTMTSDTTLQSFDAK